MPDKWNTIEWPQGPYIPAIDESTVKDYGVMLIDKKKDLLYCLTPEQQEVAMLFASKLLDRNRAKEILNDRICKEVLVHV